MLLIIVAHSLAEYGPPRCWQGEDPRTDFRGAGFLSVEALLFLSDRRRATFLGLMRKEAGRRSEWEYPFGAAAVNICFTLQELLELGGEGLPKSAAGRGFMGLLGSSESAFEEVFVAAYQLLDVVWLEQGATYMEFPAVMRCARSVGVVFPSCRRLLAVRSEELGDLLSGTVLLTPAPALLAALGQGGAGPGGGGAACAERRRPGGLPEAAGPGVVAGARTSLRTTFVNYSWGSSEAPRSVGLCVGSVGQESTSPEGLLTSGLSLHTSQCGSLPDIPLRTSLGSLGWRVVLPKLVALRHWQQ